MTRLWYTTVCTMDRKPDFMIIGAMKSATSTLHEQLALQQGVFMSTPKEPNFFSDEPEFARGLPFYWALFAAAPAGALCGESSTHYTKLPRHPHVVDRIAEHVPDAKFIYVMRHPIDRLVSHYVHEWSQRVLDIPIGRALDEHPALLDFSRYTMQLAPYLQRFGKDRVLPVFFDRLRAHPQAELERVCRFIGAPGHPTWQDLEAQNVSAERMRTSRLRDLIVGLPGLAYLRRRFVPQSIRDRIKSLWTMRERPQLSDFERARLEREFDADLATLGQWLGADLSCQNFKKVTRDRSLEWASAAPSFTSTSASS